MSIFDQTNHDNPSTAAIAKKQAGINEATREMTNIFRDIRKDDDGDTPNWSFMLANAVSSTQKMQVRAAKEEYELQAKHDAWEQAQVRNDARIDSILKKPLHERNKQFWDELQKADSSSFWNARCQRQRQMDKKTLGLAFHLKAR
jgi:hypothetical protein